MKGKLRNPLCTWYVVYNAAGSKILGSHIVILSCLNFRLTRRWHFWRKSQKKTKWLVVSHALRCHLGQQQRYDDFQSLNFIYAMSGAGSGGTPGGEGWCLENASSRRSTSGLILLRNVFAMTKCENQCENSV